MKGSVDLVTVALLALVLVAVWQLLPLWVGLFRATVAP